MLYVIGLGLSWKDISLRGLEAIHDAQKVYLEGYTSVSDFSVRRLERLVGKKITVLNRHEVEETQEFLEEAKTEDVALLVYGDPLSATTHFELLQEAKKRGIKTEVVHAPSVFSAVAETGLSLYRFGQVASIPFREEGFEPESFFSILQKNKKANAHTLFLLDLKPEKKQFLTPSQAVDMLLKIAKKRKDKTFTEDTFCIVCSRLGSLSQVIKAGNALELKKFDFGKLPYCLIVPAKLNFKEEEHLYGILGGKR